VALTAKWDWSGALSISGARAATLCILIVARSQVVDQGRRSDAHNFSLRQLESDKDARAAAIMPQRLGAVIGLQPTVSMPRRFPVAELTCPRRVPRRATSGHD
jgi:hypothetical protein